MQKHSGNKVPLAILSSILAQSCVTLYLNYVYREGLHMIVLVYLIVLLRELLVSSVFLQENREEKQNH